MMLTLLKIWILLNMAFMATVMARPARHEQDRVN